MSGVLLCVVTGSLGSSRRCAGTQSASYPWDCSRANQERVAQVYQPHQHRCYCGTICHRGPCCEEDEVILKQLEKASHPQALIYVQTFNHPDICWKDNTAKCIENHFLAQVIKETTIKSRSHTLGKTICGCESWEQPQL